MWRHKGKKGYGDKNVLDQETCLLRLAFRKNTQVVKPFFMRNVFARYIDAFYHF